MKMEIILKKLTKFIVGEIKMSGILYFVATPIGNLEDITLRAVRVLNEVDLIAAEDTRRTLKLLNHLKISKPLTSYYEHNKKGKGSYLIKELLAGKNIALVSDAGTPGVSDPGEDIVKQAIQNDINVTSVPGACAAINGLILSGQGTERFAFEGFLPANKKLRKEILLQIKEEVRTLIFYEAPHKLLNTLKDMLEVLEDRKISLAREMTKKFEEVVRTTISEAVEKYTVQSPKGEFVIIVEGHKKSEEENQWANVTILEHIDAYIRKGVDKKEAIKIVAKERGISKREVYNTDINEKLQK